jgi:hypothetical protein
MMIWREIQEKRPSLELIGLQNSHIPKTCNKKSKTKGKNQFKNVGVAGPRSTVLGVLHWLVVFGSRC